MIAPQRIHIIGGPGSGKSFLAGRLSEQLEYPHVDLDTIYWNEDFSCRTDPALRSARLQKAVTKDSWVIEGAYCDDWLHPSFEAADTILSLHMEPWLQKARLARRLGSRALHGEVNFKSSLNLLRWVDGFEDRRSNFPAEYEPKVVPIIGRAGVNAYLASLPEADIADDMHAPEEN